MTATQKSHRIPCDYILRLNTAIVWLTLTLEFRMQAVLLYKSGGAWKNLVRSILNSVVKLSDVPTRPPFIIRLRPQTAHPTICVRIPPPLFPPPLGCPSGWPREGPVVCIDRSDLRVRGGRSSRAPDKHGIGLTLNTSVAVVAYARIDRGSPMACTGRCAARVEALRQRLGSENKSF